MVTDTSRNLVRVFFLREKLKDLTGGKWTGKRVHVIGAGAMGGDIAAWCAWHGLTVTLADMKTEPLGAAIKRAAELYGKIGHKGTAIRDALDRLVPDLHGEGVRTADLVIEAVPEVARAQAQGLCGDRAEDAARTRSSPPTRRAFRWRSCAPAWRGRTGSSACTSSIRCRACNWSRW